MEHYQKYVKKNGLKHLLFNPETLVLREILLLKVNFTKSILKGQFAKLR